MNRNSCHILLRVDKLFVGSYFPCVTELHFEVDHNPFACRQKIPLNSKQSKYCLVSGKSSSVPWYFFSCQNVILSTVEKRTSGFSWSSIAISRIFQIVYKFRLIPFMFNLTRSTIGVEWRKLLLPPFSTSSTPTPICIPPKFLRPQRRTLICYCDINSKHLSCVIFVQETEELLKWNIEISITGFVRKMRRNSQYPIFQSNSLFSAKQQ